MNTLREDFNSILCISYFVTFGVCATAAAKKGWFRKTVRSWHRTLPPARLAAYRVPSFPSLHYFMVAPINTPTAKCSPVVSGRTFWAIAYTHCCGGVLVRCTRRRRHDRKCDTQIKLTRVCNLLFFIIYRFDNCWF